MALYIDYSARIYSIYLKYIAPEDMHVYSIDEVFMDVTDYLDSYKMTAHQLAMTIIRDVLKNTGITATAGIGTNMYLCKVAMDIVAKRMPADSDGVRIAELDEMAYRRPPERIPMNREEYTSLVIRARTMAITGGINAAQVPYRAGVIK